jgi:3'(2'), 5'-bisphosphate nucleotidase
MSGALGEALAPIAEEAAAVILPLFRTGLEVTRKLDESPVTIADQQAEALILARLAERFPDIPVISEEDASENGVPKAAARRFFLVDPLDGTKAFVRGTEHFTVNIGLVEDGEPTAGVVCQPVTGEIWFTTAEGAAKRRAGETRSQAVRARPWPGKDALALVSLTLKDDQERWLRGEYGYGRLDRMDSSVKFCRLAEGSADIYPRHGPTMEWDTAAADAVLRAAGGSVRTVEGEPLRYGKADRGFLNPSFIARGA